MPVTVYRYDDVGAPTLSTPSAGSLISVLDACLVNGYGTKAPAGWTKPFSGTNLAAYRQGGGSRFYLHINDGTGTGKVRAVGYESMTDVSPGVNAFPTVAQMSTGIQITLSYTAAAETRAWMVFADEKRFYLWTGYNLLATSALSVMAADGLGQSMFFFGDIVSFKPSDAYCCQIIGPRLTDQSGEEFAGSSTINYGQSGHYIARNAAATAGSVNNSKTYDYRGGKSLGVIGHASGIPYPDPVSGSLNLSRILIGNGVAVPAIRGRLPGCWASLNALPGKTGDTFSGVGDLSGREFMLVGCETNYTPGRVAIETSNTWD